MTEKRKILAISGSIRQFSTNLYFIKAISRLCPSVWEFEIYKGLATLPHFNPDMTEENIPVIVTDFRNKLRECDGFLICTPEYALGVPGTLKNAIDWTVSSGEFSDKPTALITASSFGQNGHNSLSETLKVIGAIMTEQTQLVISFAKTKINEHCEITDGKTLIEIKNLIIAFENLLESLRPQINGDKDRFQGHTKP
jgi:chromate reductase, NAD(P)H dehydrogenase (quinone)